MPPKPFASSADLADKEQTLEVLADGVYALTAEGDPNVGAIEGEDFLVCFEARATPVAARRLAGPAARAHRQAGQVPGALPLPRGPGARRERVRRRGDRRPRAAPATLIAERGKQDWESEYGRMPRLFKEPDSIPGLTWPTLTFSDRLTIDLGGDRGDLVLQYCGRGHTAGDIVAWLPRQRILFAGDLVEAQAALYTGDAFHRDWSTGTLDRVAAFGAETLVGGRGAVPRGRERGGRGDRADPRTSWTVMLDEVGAVHAARRHACKEAFEAHPRRARGPSSAAGRSSSTACRSTSHGCGTSSTAIDWPRIWTAERDREVWDQLQG